MKRARSWSQLLSMPQLHRSARVLFYTSMVRPLLEYGCAVWSPNTSQSKKLEAVQMECLRTPQHKAYQAAPAVLVRPEHCARQGSHGSPHGLLQHHPHFSWSCSGGHQQDPRLSTRCDLDEASWREKIRESGFERVEDGVPVRKELHLVWTDFDKREREKREGSVSESIKRGLREIGGQSLFKRVGSDVPRRL